MKAILVDDHVIVLAGLKIILSKLGFDEILELDDPERLTKVLKAEQPDLLVLDLDFPDQSGFHLIEKVKRLDQNFKLVIFTRHEGAVFTQRCMDAGVDGYLNKGSSLFRIEDGLKGVLAGEKYIDNGSTQNLIAFYHQHKLVQQLTDREFEIFSLLVNDHSYSEIAEKCNISIKTVGSHRTKIAQKLQLDSLSEMKELAETLKMNR